MNFRRFLFSAFLITSHIFFYGCPDNPKEIQLLKIDRTAEFSRKVGKIWTMHLITNTVCQDILKNIEPKNPYDELTKIYSFFEKSKKEKDIKKLNNIMNEAKIAISQAHSEASSRYNACLKIVKSNEKLFWGNQLYPLFKSYFVSTRNNPITIDNVYKNKINNSQDYFTKSFNTSAQKLIRDNQLIGLGELHGDTDIFNLYTYLSKLIFDEQPKTLVFMEHIHMFNSDSERGYIQQLRLHQALMSKEYSKLEDKQALIFYNYYQTHFDILVSKSVIQNIAKNLTKFAREQDKKAISSILDTCYAYFNDDVICEKVNKLAKKQIRESQKLIYSVLDIPKMRSHQLIEGFVKELNTILTNHHDQLFEKLYSLQSTEDIFKRYNYKLENIQAFKKSPNGKFKLLKTTNFLLNAIKDYPDVRIWLDDLRAKYYYEDGFLRAFNAYDEGKRYSNDFLTIDRVLLVLDYYGYQDKLIQNDAKVIVWAGANHITPHTKWDFFQISSTLSEIAKEEQWPVKPKSASVVCTKIIDEINDPGFGVLRSSLEDPSSIQTFFTALKTIFKKKQKDARDPIRAKLLSTMNPEVLLNFYLGIKEQIGNEGMLFYLAFIQSYYANDVVHIKGLGYKNYLAKYLIESGYGFYNILHALNSKATKVFTSIIMKRARKAFTPQIMQKFKTGNPLFFFKENAGLEELDLTIMYSTGIKEK